MSQEKEKYEKLNEQHLHILEAVSEVQRKAEAARTRLAKLHEELPEMIFKAATGEATHEDVNYLYFDIVEAERAVAAGDLIVKPAHRAATRLGGEIQKASRRVGYRRDYDALKDKISEAGAATDKDAEALRHFCLLLTGNEDEANSILAKLSSPPEAA